MSKETSYVQWALEPYGIGTKLRALRMGKRLTMARLSAETGLSTALLSKLETDRMIPTLPTLATICKVYGVGLGYFFSEPTRQTLSITRNSQLRSDGRSGDPVRTVPLNSPGPATRLTGQVVELTPGSAAEIPAPQGETASLLYVLEGKLQLETGGLLETLEQGDCAYIETDRPVAWSAAGKAGCRLLAVVPAGPRPA